MNLASIRLISQQIAATNFKTPKQIVAWMGAMQAQDYAMVKWAIGIRLPNSTEQIIETAIHNGDIIRTHVLRPTWHIVSADDIPWMLALTAPRVKAAMKLRRQELGLSESILAKSNAVLEKALHGGKHCTREELVAELAKAKIATDENRASHLFAWAELDGILCSGGTQAGKPTYALLEERVPKTKALTREEALAKLAQKYFASHAPASLQDFVWWSGLSVSDAKHGLEMVKSGFVSESIDSKTYWLPNSFSMPKKDHETVYLLPAFDEFLISYRDRSAALPFENHTKTVSSNGIFRPMVVVNGQVTGIWKRTIKKDKVLVETELFTPLNPTTQSLIAKAAIGYGRFLEKKVEIKLTI
jgi:hypothetical protein